MYFKKGILFLVFSLFLISGLLFADPTTEPCWVMGTVTGDNFTVNGLTVGAYSGSTLLKSATIGEDGSYSLNSVGANTGNLISLKVYGATFKTFTFEGFCKTSGDPWVVQNFTVSKVANGQSCSNNAICTSGNCSGGVCAAVTTGGGSSGGSEGGSSGSSSGGSSTTGTTTQDQTTTENYSSTSETVAPSQVREMLQGSNLSEDEIQEYMQAAQDGLLTIERNLEVRRTVSVNGQESFTSTFTINVRNNSDKPLKEVKIVEIIPKEIAESASQISSIYAFRVLLDDPIIEFTLPSLDIGQTINIPYVINERVTEEEFLSMQNTLSFAEVQEVQAPTDVVTPPTNDVMPYTPDLTTDTKKGISAWVWILIALVVLGIITYFVIKNKKNHSGLRR